MQQRGHVPAPQEPTHEQVAVCSALQVKAVTQHLAGRLHLGHQPGQLSWLQAVQPLALRQRSGMGISIWASAVRQRIGISSAPQVLSFSFRLLLWTMW